MLPFVFFLVGVGWALTSPVGSAPDDDYHLTSIWCAQGEQSGRCILDPGNDAARLVPSPVVRASECFRFKGNVPASCASSVMADDRLTSTERVNETAGLYPPVFYRAMGAFVGPDIERSVLLMRIVNVALGAVLLAALLRLTPAGVSSAGTLALLVSSVPLGVSIIASTNPSSWTILGVGTAWAFAWAWLRRPRALDRRGVLLLVALLVTSIMAIGSRVDAAVYLVFALVLAVTLTGWRQVLGTPWRLALFAVVAVAALVSYVSHSPVDLVGVADTESALGKADANLGLLMRNISDLPQLWSGIVGNWPLGWYDTVMPGLVPVAGTLVVGMLVMRGLSDMWLRKSVVVGLTGAALVGVPLYFLQSQRLVVGELVQPRYVLPLLILFLAMTLLGRRPSRPLLIPRAPAWVVGVALSLSLTFAFWVNAHRYMHGSDVGRFDLSVPAAWEPPVAFPLVAVVTILASIVLVAATLARSVGTSATGTRR